MNLREAAGMMIHHCHVDIRQFNVFSSYISTACDKFVVSGIKHFVVSYFCIAHLTLSQVDKEKNNALKIVIFSILVIVFCHLVLSAGYLTARHLARRQWEEGDNTKTALFPSFDWYVYAIQDADHFKGTKPQELSIAASETLIL
ncbi:hypothetical protein T11_8674 [Trichinella zimbabwensis]|uniref:Uncharacterized protein n=1 Tax=Trichinella zimbabwensis TaxID=268475 RepID=A0A0V1HJG8_9BILA|nr:hypothetical protein T11_8674 [Trichinella zimbabwensis]